MYELVFVFVVLIVGLLSGWAVFGRPYKKYKDKYIKTMDDFNALTLKRMYVLIRVKDLKVFKFADLDSLQQLIDLFENEEEDYMVLRIQGVDSCYVERKTFEG